MSEKEHPPIDPEQPMFLRLPVKCRQLVLDALTVGGFEQQAKDVESFTNDYVDPRANADRLAWIDRADAEARDGEVEFDSDATISHSEGGQYVLGWVWVDGDDDDEDLDDDEADDEAHLNEPSKEELLFGFRYADYAALAPPDMPRVRAVEGDIFESDGVTCTPVYHQKDRAEQEFKGAITALIETYREALMRAWMSSLEDAGLGAPVPSAAHGDDGVHTRWRVGDRYAEPFLVDVLESDDDSGPGAPVLGVILSSADGVRGGGAQFVDLAGDDPQRREAFVEIARRRIVEALPWMAPADPVKYLWHPWR